MKANVVLMQLVKGEQALLCSALLTSTHTNRTSYYNLIKRWLVFNKIKKNS